MPEQVETAPKVIWQPNPKQIAALVRKEFEILYGGARGGGKTDAGMAWLLYNVAETRFRALVIRKNAKDLSDWLDRARTMYAGTGAVFMGQPVEIRFPSGAKIRTGHLNDENAYSQYLGHEYHNILIEELTEIPEEKFYEQLISSCRSTVKNLRPQVFCTTNPGGLGHRWVRARWGISGAPDNPVETIDDSRHISRVFIPARVEDNPALANTSYAHVLENIKDVSLRRAWREGSWDDPLLPGQIYHEEYKFLLENGRIGDVPYDPKFPVYTYWDLGIGDATVVGFFQKINSSWHLIDYVEESGKSMAYFKDVVDKRGYWYGGHYAPHDIEQREYSSGESRHTIAGRMGLYFSVAPKMTIEDGINAVRMKLPLLSIDEGRCRRFLDALVSYRRELDDKLGMPKNKPLHDWSSHGMDMLRYWAVTPDPLLPGEMQEDFSLYSHNYR